MNFPEKPKQFREWIPIEEFEKYDEKKEEVKSWFLLYKECGSRVEDRPLIAEIMYSMMAEEDFPRELKMEIFKRTYELIDDKEGGEFNKETVRVLIDMIRNENDPALRIRMITILSHDLQQRYFPDKNLRSCRLEEIKKIIRKIDAFESLIREPSLAEENDRDRKIADRYSKWARVILNPMGVVEVLNKLYEKDNQNVDITPKILEDIIQQTDNVEKEYFGEDKEESIESEEDQGSAFKEFTGRLMRMALRFPSLEKIKEFEDRTGRSLPICFVYRVGKNNYSINFPDRFSRQAMDYIEKFRRGLITREEVFELVNPLAISFLSKLNSEQRKKLLSSSSLEIRFATERSKLVRGNSKENSGDK